MADTRYDVIGVGNAIVDVLAPVEESFLAEHGLDKAMMTLIDGERGHALYEAMPPAVEVSGGSAANTLAGIASFGGAGAYIGKWLQSFREFPPRQKPGSFNLDRVMEAITKGAGDK